MKSTLVCRIKQSRKPSKPGNSVARALTEVILMIPATVEFDPDILNLNSKGKWVTIYIELPEGHGYEVGNIDIGGITLNDDILAMVVPTEIGDYDSDGIFDMMVKFDR